MIIPVHGASAKGRTARQPMALGPWNAALRYRMLLQSVAGIVESMTADLARATSWIVNNMGRWRTSGAWENENSSGN